MKPRITATGMSVISLLVDVTLAQSTAPPAPIYPTTPPALNRIIVEEEYHFHVRQYSPAVEVKIVRREYAAYDSPEAAAIAGISAMASRDFEWFRSTWDKASQAMLEGRDQQHERGPAFWIKAWERAFNNRRIDLTARIETGEYVLIAYRLQAQGKDDIELVIPLKSNNGTWLATQELASDPVLSYWKTPNFRPRRVVRAAPSIK